MNFLYFAEKKLERFYDFVVERTEEKTTKVIVKEVEGQMGLKGKGTLGSILAQLGLASVEVEADVSASGRLSFSKEIVSQFTGPQKLKALLLKLDIDGRLANLNASIRKQSLPKEGMSVVFTTWLQADIAKRNESEIERIKAAIFTGKVDSYTIEIQSSLVCMSSENAWRRLQSRPRFVAGFGTLIGIDSNSHVAEIDPIVFGYAQPD